MNAHISVWNGARYKGQSNRLACTQVRSLPTYRSRYTYGKWRNTRLDVATYRLPIVNSTAAVVVVYITSPSFAAGFLHQRSRRSRHRHSLARGPSCDTDHELYPEKTIAAVCLRGNVCTTRLVSLVGLDNKSTPVGVFVSSAEEIEEDRDGSSPAGLRPPKPNQPMFADK